MKNTERHARRKLHLRKLNSYGVLKLRKKIIFNLFIILMNNLINNFNDKIIEVNDKLNNLKESYNLKNNSKKVNLLNLKLQEYIQSINDTINEFICDEVNSFNINREIMQIVEQKDNTDEIIKIFGPYILLYQLSKIA